MKKSSVSNPALLAANCLIMVQHGIILLLLGPMVPEIMKTYGIGESTAGVLLSAGSLGFMIGPLLGGLLIDRKGLKFTLLLAFFTEAVMLVLFGSVPVFIAAVIFNFGLIFMGGQLETAANYIPTIIRGTSAGSVMNLVHFFFSIGAFIGPLLIGFFLSRGGRWQSVFFAAALFTLILAMFFVFNKLKDAPSGGGTVRLRSIFRSARHPAVIFGALTLLIYVGAEIGFSSWVVHYLEKNLSFSKIYASFGLSILWIGIMAGRLINTFLARKISGRLLVYISSALGVISGTVFIFMTATTQVCVVIFFIGIAMSGIYPHTMSEINRRFPENAGMVTGILTLGAGAGAMIFQWLIGMTAEYATLQLSMVFTPVLLGTVSITLLLAVRSFRKNKRGTSSSPPV